MEWIYFVLYAIAGVLDIALMLQLTIICIERISKKEITSEELEAMGYEYED